MNSIVGLLPVFVLRQLMDDSHDARRHGKNFKLVSGGIAQTQVRVGCFVIECEACRDNRARHGRLIAGVRPTTVGGRADSAAMPKKWGKRVGPKMLLPLRQIQEILKAVSCYQCCPISFFISSSKRKGERLCTLVFTEKNALFAPRV